MMTQPSKLPFVPFQANWLQSLTHSAKFPAALQIKPLLSDIDSLSSFSPLADRQAAAERLWKLAEAQSLTSLLTAVPANQPAWLFSDEDRFRFFKTNQELPSTSQAWMETVGALPHTWAFTVEVTQLDWTELLRKEMLHHGRSLNSSSIPSGSLLQIPCQGSWDGSAWSFTFRDPNWLQLRFEERAIVERPALHDLQDRLDWTLAEGTDRIDPKKKCPTDLHLELAWIDDNPKLAPFHQKLLANLSSNNPWLHLVWLTVWPVIYRQTNQLKSPCNLEAIRQNMAICFAEQPNFTSWMFAYAKLIAQHQLGRGLGASVEFTNA